MDRGGLTASLVLLGGDGVGQRTQRKERRMPTQQIKKNFPETNGKVDLNPLITHFTTPGRAEQEGENITFEPHGGQQ